MQRRRKNDEEKQSALLQGEIDVIKKKFSNSQKNCNMLDKEFFNSVMQAEKMNDITSVDLSHQQSFSDILYLLAK